MMEKMNMDIKKHLESLPKDLIERKISEFKEDSFVILNDLFPQSLKDSFVYETKFLISNHHNRRDLSIKVTENSPRKFYNVNRDTIKKYGDFIPSFFNSDVVLNLLTKINNDETVHRIPYQPEEYIINSQQSVGDTHGWHWDDYTFAFIWVIDAPKEDEGALLEYIPNTTWDKSDYQNCISKVLDSHEVKSRYLPEGTCYLMKAGTTLHRITPLLKDSTRTVIVFSYASGEDLKKEITHETMEEIYN
ncbi:hypothetical protein SFC65_19475 [Priestia filamentosa]|uniref:HalD/BesD family halogenase n=1 Tax=Priestia filamentosa TaxID=1402861 RepID=UPI0039828F8B